ncbi:MAG: sarcosine oxidase subunit alpha [Pelagibacteraceae bacterium BACL5 MAG-120705-bin12]|jgi:sarcosine oxidase, subunit alpha|uniref:sarcosine oxidase subunit alpha family protein n=1 Tax=Candidatus Pelagibacter sp. TaxID=2024849 RepID=UPI0007133592|nr:MAG: sarcosine oxidase subunit alpha [Pelagibacteraceae bacterium BACL5 MAG-121015-bin10]KRO61720.1 MAG: sarcosine oxidase subunit alpha [Pelagibacteraceae bacterium BACL5 MAG-120705-bin12]KRO65426.1 MAG: sarcosine oxidase subunit alpha [Pelagibacteraceae bacterium BACL5 MAG-120820-bin39]
MSKNLRVKTSKFIDETTRVSFKFNSKNYYGYKGDTLASALIANGIHLVGRSFKYHRPRGIMTAGSEEPNAIVQLNNNSALSEPNVRATEVEIYDGLEASSQNCWPSVNFDIGGINNFLSPLLPAGFYYKTFMWPASFWEKYEYFIRKSAGLGKSPAAPDPDIYDHKYIHCDVLVIGGGISGIMAAKTAAQNGLNTLLVEEKPNLGGTTIYQNSEQHKINNQTSSIWLEKEIANLESLDNLEIKTRTSVAAFHGYNFLLARENLTDHLPIKDRTNKVRQRLLKIRAKKVITATGSLERPLVFNNNDRPGILLSSAIKKYIDFYGVSCGEDNVLFTNNDSAYETALSLFKKGIRVKAIVDIREQPSSKIIEEVESNGIKIYKEYTVVNTEGYKKINKISIMQLSKDGQSVIGSKIDLDCDCLGLSGGWTPAVHLFTQSGGKLRFRDEDQVFIPNHYPSKQISIGSCNGDFELDEILNLVPTQLKNFLEIEKTEYENLSIEISKNLSKRNIWLLPSDKVLGKTKPFVDYQNDATAKDIKLALREGFRSIEHVKRYTTTGMGTDQGKLGNMHALGIIAETAGVKMGELGTTTFRPPYTPLSFGTIVGRNVGEYFDIFRKTTIHEWHVKNNAEFENVGQWKRAWYYPKTTEDMHQAVQRESKAARESAGILDASTLGKIDIQGTDASEFLNRVYTNTWSKLGIGKCRYGLMLHEDGMVYDDGVTTRLDENHYIMTTTTGGAANVMSKLEDYLQTEWPELDVYLTSVTDHFATISVCGPNSKKIVSKVIPDLDLSDENFPHMSFKNAKIDKVKCRVMRISFTGEHSYEINIQASFGKSVWEKCMEAGKEFNITPYGTETMHLLRAEKGFIIVGQDTDATMTPIDLQMDWIVSKKKYDFIGKRSLYRSDTIREDRKQLVGLLTDDPKIVLEEGAQIVEDTNLKPIEMLGHVTSSYYSPNLNKSIALAVVRGGKNMMGKKLFIPMENKTISVTVADPVFLDKENKRLNA